MTDCRFDFCFYNIITSFIFSAYPEGQGRLNIYKLGYIIKENKALTIKKNLHSILYLNFCKEDTSQFYFVKSGRERTRKLIVTVTSQVPKIMAGGKGNVQPD